MGGADRGLAIANGTMTMLLGGRAEDIARAEPILAALSAKRIHVGPSGAGHLAKLINNLLCAAHLLTAAEALAFAKAAGVDPERMIEAAHGRADGRRLFEALVGALA